MPREGYGRKKWSGGDANLKIQVEKQQEEVLPAYEEYLILLQERNRLIKRLKKKDDRTIELERKEQGFSLYVNGANTDLQFPAGDGAKQPLTARTRARKTKTAGESGHRAKLTSQDLAQLESEHEAARLRAKTAPEKARRKNWLANSVNIKTARGEKVKVKAPELLTGNYDDDFEDIEASALYQSSDDNDDVSSDEEDESPGNEKSGRGKREGKSHSGSSSGSELGEQVTLSVADVKKLRQSLEMNASIRESLARQAEEASDSDVDREPDIPEEEEIEEEVEEEVRREKRPSSVNRLKPDDMIVLEFAPPKTRDRSAGRTLAAARKTDVEALGALKSNPSSARKSKDKSHSSFNKPPHDLILKADSPNMRKQRPLSASRKSKDKSPDPTGEAKAVLDALKEENENMERQKRGSHSAPGRHDGGLSPARSSEKHLRPSSVSSSWKDRLKPTPCTDGAHLPQSAPSSNQWNEGTGNINTIVQKVLQLDAKGQSKLLRALAQLEDGASLKPEELATLKASMSTSPTKLNAGSAAENLRESGDRGSKIDVWIQLLSNWGHSTRIGLTEIQLFDMNKCRVQVDAAQVRVSAAQHPKGDAHCLFNNKYKTVKERNMWSCDYRPGKPVDIMISVPCLSADFNISRIKVFNFNKSLNDLNIGVKQMRIRIGGHLAFDGSIDKGCGNQVFDYGKTIDVIDEDDEVAQNRSSQNGPPAASATLQTPGIDNVSFISEEGDSEEELKKLTPRDSGGAPPTVRSETRTMLRSTDQGLALPVVGSTDVSRSQSKRDVVPALSHHNDSQPQESQSRKKKNRKSKMAARLSGNSSSQSVSDSTASIAEEGASSVKHSTSPTDQDCKIKSANSSPTGSAKQRPAKSLDNGILTSPRIRRRESFGSSRDIPVPNSPRLLRRTPEPRNVPSSPRDGSREREEGKSVPLSPRERSRERKEALRSGSLERRRSVSKSPPDGNKTPPRPRSRSASKERDKPLAPRDIPLSPRRKSQEKEKTKMSKPPLNKKQSARDLNDNQTSKDGEWGNPHPQRRPPSGQDSNTGASVDGSKSDSHWRQAPGEPENKPVSSKPPTQNPSHPVSVPPSSKKPASSQLKAPHLYDDRDLARSRSPLGSEDETPMIQQIRKLTKEPPYVCRPQWLQSTAQSPAHNPDKKSAGIPSWLSEADSGSSSADSLAAPFPSPPESRSGRASTRPESGRARPDSGRNAGRPEGVTKLDMDLLDNWPKAGMDHLTTVLDSSDKLGVPSHGRRSNRTTTPDHVADEGEEERYRNIASAGGDEMTPEEDELPRMKRIESARAQWRVKEQNKLEESWTSLSLFERSQKGRLSMDMEDDIMDEYLNKEIARPTQPTIPEEEPMQVTDLDDFTIPELPVGHKLCINIKSTWGDRHYVGLNGIEVYTTSGHAAVISKIEACPSDINILPEYDKDPRVVTNLIDAVNRTRDDTHMWLAPFTAGNDHLIYITFEKPVSIAIMRIWNYNKSRIHSYRGAKDIEITLDGTLVFKGEVARACGGIMGGSECFGDTILFTMDEDILELVSQYDKTFEADIYADDDGEDEERPKTADDGQGHGQERPFTCAARGQRQQAPVPSLQNLPIDAADTDNRVLMGQKLSLNFTQTWGDPYYLGLTGMEIVGKDGEALPLSLEVMEADPRDLHVLPGYETDDRTLDKLIDGHNITVEDEHMWLIPFTQGENHWLRVILPQPTEMCGLRFWNYNKSSEDTYRGAKIVHIQLDGKQVSPLEGFLIRKGPGNCFFDFAQEVSFTEPQTPRVTARDYPTRVSASLVMDEPSQEYEAIQMPCGFIYQLHLLTTWGDPYYVGLNGLEFFDAEGNKIELVENNISAYPDSVNVLNGVVNDVRTPNKLIDGVNDTQDGTHMWIAPILPSIINRVYVIFDTPMEVSLIKLWNYSKTPNRGVKDFALLVDDLLVYNGSLEPVPQAARGIIPNCDVPQPYHTILFTDNKDIRRKEKHTIIMNKAGEQDVQLMNDRQVMAKYTDPKTALSGKPADQAMRPTTSVTGGRKGPKYR